jgi:hypothetical protein
MPVVTHEENAAWQNEVRSIAGISLLKASAMARGSPSQIGWLRQVGSERGAGRRPWRLVPPMQLRIDCYL